MRLLPRVGISVVAGLVFTEACATQPPAPVPQQQQFFQAVAPPERNGPAKPLSRAARDVLKARMESHARDMSDLVSAIMVLDYPGITGRADAIAGDVNLSRPITRDATELNAALPEEFFVRQDELRARAKALATAARAGNAALVAGEYGRLAEGCVRCHADFRPAD